MNCDRLHELLDAWTTGELSVELRDQLEAHAADCAECASVLRHSHEDSAGFDDDLVVRPVLAATTGRTCGQVEWVLAGDPRASEVELEWARDHAAHCEHCARFEAWMAALPELLPTLAERDPGPDFTAEVLLATLPGPSLGSVFVRRVRDHVDRWQRRPEFAQELSFVLTLALLVVTFLPGSPLRDVPRQALSVVQLSGSGTELSAAVGGDGEGTVGHELRQGLRMRGERLGVGFDRLGTHVLQTGKGLVDGDLQQVGEGASQIGCDLRRLWKGVQSPATDPDSVCG
jgi:hypothetical protein